MRSFYLGWPLSQIRQTASVESQKLQTPSAQFTIADIAKCFSLPWSQYVRLLPLKNPEASSFYEKEALRGGWTVRQLERQIGTQFYERTALSRNKAAMLKKGEKALLEEKTLVAEVERTRRMLEERAAVKAGRMGRK